jgi:hypothetical protein
LPGTQVMRYLDVEGGAFRPKVDEVSPFLTLYSRSRRHSPRTGELYIVDLRADAIHAIGGRAHEDAVLARDAGDAVQPL